MFIWAFNMSSALRQCISLECFLYARRCTHYVYIISCTFYPAVSIQDDRGLKMSACENEYKQRTEKKGIIMQSMFVESLNSTFSVTCSIIFEALHTHTRVCLCVWESVGYVTTKSVSSGCDTIKPSVLNCADRGCNFAVGTEKSVTDRGK